MTVGEKIRAIRVAKEMTLAEVEGRAGLTDGNLSRVERGKQWASEAVLRSLAEALEVKVADFFDNDAPLPNQAERSRPLLESVKQAMASATDEVRLLTVYRLASGADRAEIDAVIADVIERLDVLGLLHKR